MQPSEGETPTKLLSVMLQISATPAPCRRPSVCSRIGGACLSLRVGRWYSSSTCQPEQTSPCGKPSSGDEVQQQRPAWTGVSTPRPPSTTSPPSTMIFRQRETRPGVAGRRTYQRRVAEWPCHRPRSSAVPGFSVPAAVPLGLVGFRVGSRWIQLSVPTAPIRYLESWPR